MVIMLLLIPMKSMLFLLAWFNSSLHRLTDSQCWRANDRSKQCIVIISMSIYVHVTMTIHAIFWDKNQFSDLTHYCIDSNDHCADWNDHHFIVWLLHRSYSRGLLLTPSHFSCWDEAMWVSPCLAVIIRMPNLLGK